MDACIDGELFHLCEEDIQNGMLGWGTNGSPKNKKKWMVCFMRYSIKQTIHFLGLIFLFQEAFFSFTSLLASTTFTT